MAIEDILKAFAAFDQGITTYAVNKATGDFKTKLSDLNKQTLDAEQKLIAQSNLTNQFALSLQQAGADPTQIQALTQRMGVSAGAQFEAIQREQAQESSQEFANEQLDRQHELRLEEIEQRHQNQQELSKEDRAFRERMKDKEIKIQQQKEKVRAQRFAVGELGKFKLDPNAKPAYEGLVFSKKLARAVQPVNGRVDPSQITAAIKAWIRATGDTRISETDVATGTPNPSVKKRIRRNFKLQLSDEAIQDDTKFFTALAEKINKESVADMQKAVRGYAAARAPFMGDIDPNVFEQSLMSQALAEAGDIGGSKPEAQEQGPNVPDQVAGIRRKIVTYRKALRANIHPVSKKQLTPLQRKSFEKKIKGFVQDIDALEGAGKRAKLK